MRLQPLQPFAGSTVAPRILALMVLALGGVDVAAGSCDEVVARSMRRTAVDAWLQVERLPGVAVAATAQQLSTLRGGRVERVAVAAGARVAAGDELLRLQSDPLQRELEAARSLRAVADSERLAQEAEVERMDRERARRDAHPQLFAREEREAHSALLKSARARLAAAQAHSADTRQRVQALEREQDALRVTAGSAGVVGQVRVQLGQIVPAGAPLLDMVGATATIFRFALPASRGDALRVGDALCVVAADSTSAPVAARVQRLSASISGAAQMIVAEAAPLAPIAASWQGLSVDVLPLAARAGAWQ